MRIAHLTSVHQRYDTRIFYKECRSLAKAGYDTILVVADGGGREKIDGVEIIGIALPKSRLKRALLAPGRMLGTARRLDCDIYHVHDPELILLGLALALLKKMVVFDAHEDVPKQLLTKPYLTPSRGKLLSRAFWVFERIFLPGFHGIVAATPTIERKYRQWHRSTATICNYPILGELGSSEGYGSRPNEVTYVGGLSRIRGMESIVAAMRLVRTKAQLNLIGSFSPPSYRDLLSRTPGWEQVRESGFLDRKGVQEALARSRAGLVVLLPTPSYLDSLPIKLFEYMSCGIPVVASGFPVWREIVDGAKCGLCVDPEEPSEIAAAIDWIMEHPAESQEMGRNGKEAVERVYNWHREEEKLIAFYAKMHGAKARAGRRHRPAE